MSRRTTERRPDRHEAPRHEIARYASEAARCIERSRAEASPATAGYWRSMAANYQRLAQQLDSINQWRVN